MEASIRLDGTNLINCRMTEARRVSIGSGSLLLSLLSSSDTSTSFKAFSKRIFYDGRTMVYLLTFW